MLKKRTKCYIFLPVSSCVLLVEISPVELHIHALIQISAFSPFLEPGISDSWTDNLWFQYSVLHAFNFISCYFPYPHSSFSHLVPISQTLHTFPSSKYTFSVLCANCYVKLLPADLRVLKQNMQETTTRFNGMVIPVTNDGRSGQCESWWSYIPHPVQHGTLLDPEHEER